MSKKNEILKVDELLEKVKTYIDQDEELELLRNTYLFAYEKHKGQFRKSGEEYIVHPLNVAYILTDVYADIPTLQAAIMHDVLEDCDCTKDEMESMFGHEVTVLVQGVTKLSKINFSTENDYLIEYYKKIIVGISEDVRVIIIKLADRLHNMRTLWALPEEKQKIKAKESMEILAPIAHHLGIHKIKSELEDLSLRYLKPEVFYDIAEKLNTSKLERDKTVLEMQEIVSKLLTEHNIAHEIKGRAKSIYSIYNKLSKGKKFSDIYDLHALRILVDTEQECYVALGIIHSKFRPLPNRFKDYVAMPKPNMYQSLHTTVFGLDGYLFEIQIRTYQMDEIAENGIASHWAYKENRDAKANMQSTTEQKLQFFKSIMDLSSDKLSSEEFVNSVKDEVLNDNIYVFTPKGDIIELAKGSTPIDFAYKVHTKVGETMVGAIVNNSIVSLDYELQNNDIVKINTNKTSRPSKEWIQIAKTTHTKNKIRSYFTKNEREIYIERGRESLEKELRKRKLAFAEFLSDSNVSEICRELKLKNIEEVYQNIGNGKHAASTVIHIITKEEQQKPKIARVGNQNTDANADIVVSGIDQVKVNLAQCCNPVFGDDIIGYITMGNGISVHRSNCHNLASLEDRNVLVSWNQNINKRYLTYLILQTKDKTDHMLDIIQKTSILDIPVDSIHTIGSSSGIVYEMRVYVRNLEHLNKMLLELKKQTYVEKVERIQR